MLANTSIAPGTVPTPNAGLLTRSWIEGHGDNLVVDHHPQIGERLARLTAELCDRVFADEPDHVNPIADTRHLGQVIAPTSIDGEQGDPLFVPERYGSSITPVVFIHHNPARIVLYLGCGPISARHGAAKGENDE